MGAHGLTLSAQAGGMACGSEVGGSRHLHALVGPVLTLHCPGFLVKSAAHVMCEDPHEAPSVLQQLRMARSCLSPSGLLTYTTRLR